MGYSVGDGTCLGGRKSQDMEFQTLNLKKPDMNVHVLPKHGRVGARVLILGSLRSQRKSPLHETKWTAPEGYWTVVLWPLHTWEGTCTYVHTQAHAQSKE